MKISGNLQASLAYKNNDNSLCLKQGGKRTNTDFRTCSGICTPTFVYTNMHVHTKYFSK